MIRGLYTMTKWHCLRKSITAVHHINRMRGVGGNSTQSSQLMQEKHLTKSNTLS